MAEVDLEEGWLTFGEKVFETAKSVFNSPKVVEGNPEARDPIVVATTLLARTMSNFEGAILMIDQSKIVEARALTRCCYENLFWIGALTKKGAAFVQAMEDDEAANKKKRAQGLLDFAAVAATPLEFETTLEKFLEELKAEYPKAATIKHYNSAADANLVHGYIIYRELSGDAAHPSASSLSRYIAWNEDGTQYNLLPIPPIRVNEVIETLEFACSAFLGVCVGANEIIKDKDADKELRALFDEFAKLSEASKKSKP
jgi:hypothetical protein